METIQVTKAEKMILNLIREFKPFEKIEISKDKEGKPDTYLVHRSQKLIISSIVVARI